MNNEAWFGHVPERWDAVPLYGISSERKVTNRGLRESNLLSLSYGRIVRKDIDTNEGLLPASFETYQIVSPNDIVLRMTDLQNDHRSLRTALVTERGIITSAYLALAVRDVDPRFMAYQFRAIDLMKVFYSMGGGLRQSIGFGDLKRLPVLTPPVNEQRAIADYLDRETAQIDAFIAKNEELIALLTERRAAVITRAVLRGTDASAELRDSGVTWLGEVPAHWRVSRLSRWFEVTLGKMLDEAKFAGTVGDVLPYVRASNIKAERLDLTDVNSMPFTPSERAKFNLRMGDLVVVEGGSIGVNAPIVEDMNGWGFQKTVNRVRSIGGDFTRFLGYQIDVIREAGVLNMITNVSTIQHLTAEKLERLVVAMPPVEEQKAILDHIARATTVIDRAIETAEEGVRLARERRAALISAAVTGKIDVGVAA